ncbi:hypothetical protein B0T21DRAFT_413655 [Apiosordaria backusii]|uniref:Azaphilone pigments biosynthesis cluster protein L N-terminal domain-containing protein n=1 Tax=Apiosordaria backusii TaxID=314023 RepID=A0AA40E8H1_9PEZI|nr:hypothetical protein B0T21DRAFT_413655 [Apiosordaria backusii]
MDPFSISVGCVALLEIATKTIKQLSELSKRYRDARVELLRVICQLQSLQHILELIRHDEAKQPTASDSNDHLIMDQVNVCMDIVEELQTVILDINDSRLKWAITGKTAVGSIYKQLQTATEQLELILGVHSLALTKDIRNNTNDLLNGQEHIGSQIRRLSEHMGLKDNVGPRRCSIPGSLPSWSRASQGVYVENTAEQGDPATEMITTIDEPTIDHGSYPKHYLDDSTPSDDPPSRTNSSHWSGPTAYSPPSTPAVRVEEITYFLPSSSHSLPAVATPWLDYQHPTSPILDISQEHLDTTLWNAPLQYFTSAVVPEPLGSALLDGITIEHVEITTPPSKEDVIRKQFKQATWALAKKQKVNSIAENFKEMVRAASLKVTASVTA